MIRKSLIATLLSICTVAAMAAVAGVPVAATSSTDGIKQLVNGDSHTCALTEASKVYCVGRPQSGQVGNGTAVPTNGAAPIDITNNGSLDGVTVVEIAAKGDATCARGDDGSMHCWGRNSYGQLGTGNLSGHDMPVSFSAQGSLAGKKVAIMSMGRDSICAVADDNTLHCSGDNSRSVFGDGTTSSVSAPTAINRMGSLIGKTIKSLSSGQYHRCAVAQDNSLHCWGANNAGQLGNGTAVDSSVPVDVTNSGSLSGKTVASVKIARGYSCALAQDSSLHCWGALGATSSSSPVDMSSNGSLSGRPVATIGVNGSHLCIGATDGSLHCMGFNSNRELGDGTTTRRDTFVNTTEMGSLQGKTISSIHAGLGYTCARTSDGEAHCIGVNSTYGQFGNNSLKSTSAYVRAMLLPISQHGTVGLPTMSIPPYIASTTDVSVTAVSPVSGSTKGGEELTITGTGFLHKDAIRQVASDGDATCVLTQIRKLFCMGLRANGIVGDGVKYTHDTTRPIDITTNGSLRGKVIDKIFMHDDTACALAEDGTVHCWGHNKYTQIGISRSLFASGGEFLPVEPTAYGSLVGKKVAQVAIGGNSICMLADDASLHCSGFNNYGEFGDGTTNSGSSLARNRAGTSFAIPMAGSLAGKTIQQLVAADRHMCALAEDATVHCWGDNTSGQLGNGTTTDSLTAVDITASGSLSGKTVVKLYGGGNDHTCALAQDNTVHCWGANADGQLGVGTTAGATNPVEITSNGSLAGKTVVDMNIVTNTTCALTEDAEMHCWGKNTNQQMGNGTTANVLSPIRVANTGSLAGKSIRSMAAGRCAIPDDNTIHCWGVNNYGQIGNGTTVDSAAPIETTSYYNLMENLAAYVAIDGTVVKGIVTSPTTITNVIAPPHAAGKVDVTVTNADATSATLVKGYEYIEADSDGDAVPDSQEDTGPNKGDGNYDSTPDGTQPNVAYFTNTVTKTDMTLASTTNCTVSKPTTTQSTDALPKDGDYTYPIGVIDYQLTCSADGDTATVTLFLDKQYDTANWTLRKYSPSKKTYSTITANVVYGTAGTTEKVTTIQYQVTDGGDLDEDGVVNGVIVDPVGPAILSEPAAPAAQQDEAPATQSQPQSTATLAETGASYVAIMTTVVALMMGGVALLKRRA